MRGILSFQKLIKNFDQQRKGGFILFANKIKYE
jgi:hypothetical protein